MRVIRILSWATFALLPMAAWAPPMPAPEAPPASPPSNQAPAPATPAASASPTAPVPGNAPLMPLTTARPKLPDSACQQRLSGTVDLDFVVMPDGKVAEVKVTASQPAGVFDGAAMESVSAWTYPAGMKPIKGHQRLALGPTDCRAEQLARPKLTFNADGSATAAPDCAALQTDAKLHGDPIGADDEPGRKVIDKLGAQAYSAPDTGCAIKGRVLNPGRKYYASMEHKGFTLLAERKGDEAAVWAWSNQLAEIGQ